MKNEELESLFEGLRGKFDLNEPDSGHQERFLEKLDNQQGIVQTPHKITWWKPLSIAASIVFLIGIAIITFSNEATIEERVVQMAPEVSNTEFYFTSLVEEQVQLMESEKTPETAQLVEDTLHQLTKLEQDYKQLELDLVNGGNSDIILNAMIINFQTRIELLKDVLANIESIKNLKSQNDENFTI